MCALRGLRLHVHDFDATAVQAIRQALIWCRSAMFEACNKGSSLVLPAVTWHLAQDPQAGCRVRAAPLLILPKTSASAASHASLQGSLPCTCKSRCFGSSADAANTTYISMLMAIGSLYAYLPTLALQREEDKADKIVQRAKAPMTKAKKKRTILTTQLTKLQNKLEAKRGGTAEAYRTTCHLTHHCRICSWLEH